MHSPQITEIFWQKCEIILLVTLIFLHIVNKIMKYVVRLSAISVRIRNSRTQKLVEQFTTYLKKHGKWQQKRTLY